VKRFVLLVLGACLSVTLNAAELVDDAGQTVQVPARVERIADAWYAHHALLMTLGAGDRIVATVAHEANLPWMFHLQPSLKQASTVNGTAFNAEDLLAHKVDLVFVSKGDRNAVAYRQLGLPVINVGFSDLDGLARSMRMTAQALGTPDALQRADAYNGYLAGIRQQLAARLKDLPAAQRLRVLHVASLNPIKVDGADTLIDEWINAVGARNAATGLKGNLQVASAEQLLQWQPDVIILAADAGDIDKAPAHALLESLNAVRQGKVLRNPAGVFPWDRYGTEIALQLQWASQQLHPELFGGQDLLAQTMSFYRQFFDYPLNRQQAQRMLAGQRPD
jgi:iron complex transport system substrate-binding protein